MRKNRRKLIVGMLVATMALTGVLIGTVSADTGEDALAQERQERMWEARGDRCQAMIDAGICTQEQADDCTAWMESRPDNRDDMQEWFESRPDMGDGCYGFGGSRMGMGGRMFSGCGMAGQTSGGGQGDCAGSYDECPRAQ